MTLIDLEGAELVTSFVLTPSRVGPPVGGSAQVLVEASAGGSSFLCEEATRPLRGRGGRKLEDTQDRPSKTEIVICTCLSIYVFTEGKGQPIISKEGSQPLG